MGRIHIYKPGKVKNETTDPLLEIQYTFCGLMDLDCNGEFPKDIPKEDEWMYCKRCLKAAKIFRKDKS